MYNQEIKLSYVLTTFNKLPYLKHTIAELLGACADDEEIVIYDGGSTDGAREYLEDLYKKGLIHQFSSEKDKGEANGYNKAILQANGELIKIITDDDIYAYDRIKQCKEFMLQNPEKDMLGSDGFDNYLDGNLTLVSHVEQFIKWTKEKTPFSFYGPGILVRKKAFPLTGLFSCLTKYIDHEFTYRASCLPVKIAWFTQPVFVRIINPDSNSLKFLTQRKREMALTDIYYEIATKKSSAELKRKRSVSYLKRKILSLVKKESISIKKEMFAFDIETYYTKCKSHLYAHRPIVDKDLFLDC